MQFTATIVPVAFGSYGPFADRNDNKTYPYVEFATEGGEGTMRATFTEGAATSHGLKQFEKATVRLELAPGNQGKGFKLRCLGRDAATLQKAA